MGCGGVRSCSCVFVVLFWSISNPMLFYLQVLRLDGCQYTDDFEDGSVANLLWSLVYMLYPSSDDSEGGDLSMRALQACYTHTYIYIYIYYIYIYVHICICYVYVLNI